MQADAELRRTPESILKLPVRNTRGESVSLGEFAKTRWTVALPKLDRYNGLPSVKISGAPAPGKSSGDAMNAIEELAKWRTLGVNPVQQNKLRFGIQPPRFRR